MFGERVTKQNIELLIKVVYSYILIPEYNLGFPGMHKDKDLHNICYGERNLKTRGNTRAFN
jgi:hypothetical protein